MQTQRRRGSHNNLIARPQADDGRQPHRGLARSRHAAAIPVQMGPARGRRGGRKGSHEALAANAHGQFRRLRSRPVRLLPALFRVVRPGYGDAVPRGRAQVGGALRRERLERGAAPRRRRQVHAPLPLRRHHRDRELDRGVARADLSRPPPGPQQGRGRGRGERIARLDGPRQEPARGHPRRAGAGGDRGTLPGAVPGLEDPGT